MLAKNQEFANKLNDTVTKLNSVLTQVDSGQGTVGKLLKDPTLYNHTDDDYERVEPGYGNAEGPQEIPDDSREGILIPFQVPAFFDGWSRSRFVMYPVCATFPLWTRASCHATTMTGPSAPATLEGKICT